MGKKPILCVLTLSQSAQPESVKLILSVCLLFGLVSLHVVIKLIHCSEIWLAVLGKNRQTNLFPVRELEIFKNHQRTKNAHCFSLQGNLPWALGTALRPPQIRRHWTSCFGPQSSDYCFVLPCTNEPHRWGKRNRVWFRLCRHYIRHGKGFWVLWKWWRFLPFSRKVWRSSSSQNWYYMVKHCEQCHSG